MYGIEKMEKAHVITDFISKGFENGVIEMMTDGKEERQFLYAEDCCKALKIIMKKSMINLNQMTHYISRHLKIVQS